MRIEELHDYGSVERLSPRWSSLIEAIDDDSPYLTAEFQLPWIRQLPAEYRCRVLTAWEGERLIGLAPLFDRSISRLGLSLRRRSFPVSGTSPPFDLIVSEQHEAVMRAFVEHWERDAGLDWIDLERVRAASATRRHLCEAIAGTRLSLQARPSEPTCYLPIGGSWDDFFATRSKRFRKGYRLYRNRCQQRGMEFLRFPGPDLDFDTAMTLAFEAIQNSWKAFDEKRESQERSHRELAAKLHERGWLSLRFLLLEGRPAAYLFEIDYRGAFYAYHNAYDLAFQEAGPGRLLLGDGIRDAHERRYKRYDVTGDRGYLRSWSPAESPLEQLTLVRRSAPSRVKHDVYRRVHDARRRRAAESVEERKTTRRAEARET